MTECRRCLHLAYHHVAPPVGAVHSCYVFRCRCTGFVERLPARVRLLGTPTRSLILWLQILETIDKALDFE